MCIKIEFDRLLTYLHIASATLQSQIREHVRLFLFRFFPTLLRHFILLPQENFPPCSFLSWFFGISQGDRQELHYWYLLSTLPALKFSMLKFFPPCSFILVFLHLGFRNISSLFVYSDLLVYSGKESSYLGYAGIKFCVCMKLEVLGQSMRVSRSRLLWFDKKDLGFFSKF